jgi:acyl-CoA synthetase (NDP forming)/RimJ/RimL family protein N-acetyltransferase
MTDRAADVLLADGATVHVRPIRPADADAIVALHARFSERTRYLRYFSPYPRIPERDLQRFVNVDHRDREALVVSAGSDLIAVGRYERLGPTADEAEVAVVVEDAHQGRGIGSTLLEHLAAAAQQAGIHRFVAEVLPVNSGMLRVFADAGYQIQREYADGVVHLVFPIAPTEESLAVQWRREQSTEARSIARLLAPRAVALYGARRDGRGIGAAVLRHLRSFAGTVYPIHPSESTVDDRPAYRSLVEAPGSVDLAVVAVPAPAVPDALADAAAAGVAGLVVLSAGFAEAGPAGAAAQDELLRAARAAGLRLVGPNCLGVANTDPAVRLNATLAPRLPERGRVGFFSQSGAFGVALLAEADRRGLGLSSFVSAGNRADVSGNDLLQYWQDDPATDVVLLYLETFGNPRKFARLARRLGRHKPIVVVAGQAAHGERPVGPGPTEVAVHRERPARPGPTEVAALFARSGVIRVDTVPEMFDVGTLLANQPLPAGTRVGIVTNSSALGVLAAGACGGVGLSVTVSCDVGPQAEPPRFAAALEATMADPEVDALVVVCAPPLPPEEEPAESAGSFAAGESDRSFAAAVVAVSRADKPLVATFLAGSLPPGVPSYPSVEEAVRALGRAAAYAAWRRESPGRVPQLSDVDAEAAQEAAAERAPAEVLLAAYGIPVVPSRVVTGTAAAEAAAEELGYPVALKVAGSALRHRQDLGAVRLDLADADEVRRAGTELARLFGADLEIIVQPMVAPGVSCVIEAVEDRALGPIVGFGPGGAVGELLGDQAWRAAPLTDRDAAALVREPKFAPLLFGYRGAAPVDTGALADLLLRVGRLIDEHPEVRHLTVNPVLARPSGASVLHASVHYGLPAGRSDTGPRRLR